MLTTNNAEYAERLARMRLHGISGDAWKRYAKEGSWYYEVLDAGYKCNLPDILAAVGVAQLAKCDQFWRRRQEIARMYQERLAGIDELELPPSCEEGDQHSWHLFILRIRPEFDLGRNGFIDELKRLGVGTSVHFIPLHLQPFYQQHFGYRGGDFPNAEDAYSRCISLPIFPSLNDSEVDRIAAAIGNVVSTHRKRVLVPAV